MRGNALTLCALAVACGAGAAAADDTNATSATSATSTTSAVSAAGAMQGTPPSAARVLLEEASAQIEAGDPAVALVTLDRIAAHGLRLTVDEFAARDELAGVALASLGNDAAAEERFARLLIVMPDHALSYTRSPKVAFPYEAARNKRRADAALTVRVQAPLVLAWKVPVALDVVVTGNPLELLRSVEVCRRLKNADEQASAAGGAAVCAPIDVTGPAASSQPVHLDLAPLQPPMLDTPTPDGGVQLQGLTLIDVRGFDATGNEVLRQTPVEIPIGFAPPPPWYTSQWLWGGVAAVGAAVVTTGLIVTAVVLTPSRFDFAAPVVNP